MSISEPLTGHPGTPSTDDQPAAVDADALMAYSMHVAGQATAVANGLLVALGDQLGLWSAMADSLPTTSATLARRTGLSERLVHEWQCAQAANGFLGFEPATGEFRLSPEAALVMAVPDSPASLIAPFRGLPALVDLLPALGTAFRSGAGIPWSDHTVGFFDTQEGFSRPLLQQLLVDGWLAAVPGLTETLTAGGLVADVGCGYGTSTILLAQAYPRSRFLGIDFHDHSIARARAAARAAGVVDRVTFEVAAADELPGSGYDLILIADALHDMGDPVGAARQQRRRLAPGGVLVTLDPVAADTLAENLADNPMAGLMYAVSTFLCTPTALAQPGGQALGAQAGEAAIRRILTEAGFPSVHRVGHDLPVNMVVVARESD